MSDPLVIVATSMTSILRESWGESAADFVDWVEKAPNDPCPQCGAGLTIRYQPVYDEDGREVDAVFCETCGLAWRSSEPLELEERHTTPDAAGYRKHDEFTDARGGTVRVTEARPPHLGHAHITYQHPGQLCPSQGPMLDEAGVERLIQALRVHQQMLQTEEMGEGGWAALTVGNGDGV